MTSLTDNAIDQIKQMIVAGRLGPGDRLPREQDLAELLGLSRGTLREAVRALAAMKVVDVRRGDGTYVTSLAPELMLEALNFVVDLHRDDTVLHFLEVRSFIEPESTARAALHADGELLGTLAELVAEGDQLSRAEEVDHERLMVNDQRFHSAINTAGGNPVAAAILAATAGVTSRARIARSVDIRAELTTVDDHRAIYEAVRTGDPARARLRAAMHIARTEDWVRQQLSAGQRWTAGLIEGPLTTGGPDADDDDGMGTVQGPTGQPRPGTRASEAEPPADWTLRHRARQPASSPGPGGSGRTARGRS